jgi:hypothetical protein
MRRGKGVSSPEAEGEGEAGAGGEAALEDSGTMRRNAASQLNQIGAEIQLTAAVREQGFLALLRHVFGYYFDPFLKFKKTE